MTAANQDGAALSDAEDVVMAKSNSQNLCDEIPAIFGGL